MDNPSVAARPDPISALPALRSERARDSKTPVVDDVGITPIPEIRGRRRTPSGLPSSVADHVRTRRKNETRFFLVMMSVIAGCVFLCIGAIGWQQGWFAGMLPAPVGEVEVAIDSTQRGSVRITIDGQQRRFADAAEISYSLPLGRHDVVVERVGFHPHRQRIDIRQGVRVEIRPRWSPRMTLAQNAAPLGQASHEQVAAAIPDSKNPIDGNTESDRVSDHRSNDVFESWVQDLDAAKQRARDEGKSVLVCFDGSDWCGYSKEMASSVFAHPEFAEYVHEAGLIPVLIDFPRREARSRVENPARNAAVADQFGIRGYPTLILLDSTGRNIDYFGYCEHGFREFRSIVGQKLQRHQERLAGIEAMTADIENGKNTTIETLTKIIPLESWGEYVDVFMSWRETSNRVDAENSSGLNETMFLSWCIARVNSLGNMDDVQRTISDLREDVQAWMGKHPPRDTVAFSQFVIRLAKICQLIDRGQSIGLAEMALAKLSGLSEETRNELESLSSNVTGTGSGFLVTDDGLVVTNAHVVRFGSAIEVQVGEDSTAKYPAEVVHTDDAADIALLRIRSEVRLRPLEFDETAPRRASDVAIVGFPGGSPRIKFVVGRVMGQDDANQIEINAMVNPGNSGGPVISPRGRVVGVISRKTRQDEMTESNGIAIPAAAVLAHLEKVLDSADFRKVRLSGGGKVVDWEKVDELTRNSVVRIATKFQLIPLSEARSLNDEHWGLVSRADADAEECKKLLGRCLETTLAWPRPEFYRTAAVAAFRCGDHLVATGMTSKTLETAELLQQLPHPVDFALFSLLLREFGNVEQSEQFRERFEFLAVRSSHADDELVREFSEKLNVGR